MKQNFSKNLKQTLRLGELKQNTKPQLVGDALEQKTVRLSIYLFIDRKYFCYWTSVLQVFVIIIPILKFNL